MLDTTKGSTNAEKNFIPADLFENFFFPKYQIPFKAWFM